MLLLRTVVGSPHSALARTIKGLLATATLLVCGGTASGVVEQDCALPGADCTLAETARQAGVFVGTAIGRPDLLQCHDASRIAAKGEARSACMRCAPTRMRAAVSAGV